MTELSNISTDKFKILISFGLPKLMYPGKKYKMMKSYSFRKFA